MDALPAVIAEHLGEVRELCEKYRVKTLKLFGSAAKGTFDPETSDLDFVVEFFPDAPGRGLSHAYFRLMLALQDLFKREVDLVERPAIKSPMFLEVLELTQRPVYESDRAA